MLQVLTPFRADEHVATGAAAMGASIGRGLQNFGDDIAEALKEKKDRNARAKASEALYKSTPELREALGMDVDDFTALSARDKTAMVAAAQTGLSLRSALARQAQSMRLDEALLQKQEMERAQALSAGEALGRLGEMGQDPSAVPAPFSDAEFDRRTRQPGIGDVLRELGAAAQRSGGGVDLRNVDDISRALAASGQDKSFDPSLVIDLPNAPGYKKTQTSRGQFQVLPPREAPEDKEPQIKLGIGEPDFMGGYPNSVTITPSQYKKHKAAIEELGFKIHPPAAGGAGGGGKPAESQFKKGDKVKQGGVLYEFDGTNWNEAR